jgi:hypothetical protein
MSEPTIAIQARLEAIRHFERAHFRAQINRVRALAARGQPSLQEFSAVAVRCGPPNQHYAGVHTVSINQIRGSESRGEDFDHDFNPRHKRSASRWIGVYAAWQEGVPLPPVELVQIGDSYFVRDGHHRISVARSLGMDYIDAEVTVVETQACPLNLPVLQ